MKVLLVYDITDIESFKNLSKWLEEAKLNGNPNMTFMLVGNKSDLESERTVKYEMGVKFAKVKLIIINAIFIDNLLIYK
jgi:GTPase SAR1 family protein